MVGLWLVSGGLAHAAGKQSETELWDTVLKPQHFQQRAISSDQAIVELRIPVRAEDSGVVPISVNAKIPQTAERYIKTLYVFIDRNPKPLAGVFHLTPEAGKADLAMRLRINEFTHVRVVAELNNGEVHMDSGYTRASGGCSEPPPFLQLRESRKHIGEMKFRANHEQGADGSVALGQLIISHPNVTGLQLDQRGVEVGGVRLVVTRVVDLHGRLINVGLKGVVRVRERRKRKGCLRHVRCYTT